MAKEPNNNDNNTATINLTSNVMNTAINRVLGPPHVILQIDNSYAAAILDTGADRSLISEDLYDSLFTQDNRPKLRTSRMRLKGATGHQLTIKGQIEMPITVGSIRLTHPMQVVSNMKSTLLLGNDIILDKITIIKGRELEMTHAGQKCTAPIEYRTPHMKVRLIDNEDIAPQSVRIVDAELIYTNGLADERATHGPLVTISQLDDHDGTFGIEDVLTQATADGRVKLLVANLQDDPITYAKGLIMAQATPTLATDNPYEPFEEMKSDGTIHYLHEQDTKEKILHGDPNGFNPIPPGYDEISPGEAIDIKTARAQSLSADQHKRLQRILQRYKGVLSTGPDDYGKTPLMAFAIETGDNKPVAARYRPIPASFEKEVRKAIKDMKENDVIEESDSAWNSTLVLVRKPNGKLRICVNLKGVNEVTTNQTNYPINQQEQSFARLCNGKYFFKLDLSQAYYAIPLATEDDRDRTAFSCFGKQYRFKVSPFGARYLPSRFNKLMTGVLEGLDHYLFYYFDDVIGCFQTPDELLDGLATVLQRLIMANLRVNFAKSDFSLTTLDRIKWLGAVIHDNKIWPDSDKIKAITEMPIPTNKNALMRFVGAVNYHRRHIHHLADAAVPLNKLVSPKAAFIMGPLQIEAFHNIKQMLTTAPALALPDVTRPFIITTDASDVGVGGVLSQKNDLDHEQIVAYCSRTLSTNEQNGSSCEKEILAILYAVSVFHFYIANAHFTLRSDSKSLVFLRHFKDLNSKLFRASLILDELSFDIQHMSATRSNLMGVADMISRAYGEAGQDPTRASYKTLREPQYEKITAPKGMPTEPVPTDEFNKMADAYLKEFKHNQTEPLDKHKLVRMCQMAHSEDDLEGILSCVTSGNTAETQAGSNSTMGQIGKITLRPNVLTPKLFQQAQREDATMGPIIDELEKGATAETARHQLHNKILCKEVRLPSGLLKTVVWVPQELVPEVLDFYHGAPQGAHRGRKQLYFTLQQFFYWNGMAESVKGYAQSCPVCKYQSPDTNPQVTMGRHHTPTEANQIVNIDIVGPFKPSSGQMKYILTMQCDFTKYVLAFPLKRKTAEEIAKTVIDHWVAPFGAPKYIRSDEGTDCDSGLMQYVCRAMNILKIRTPIYSPQANPIERWHATLGKAMRTWLDEEHYKEWPTVVPLIAHSYNTSVNTTTKLTPQQLFFGREAENQLIPILPENHPAMDKHRYLAQLQRAQQIFWKIAHKNLQQRQKDSLPKQTRDIRPYQIGDHILIRNQAKEHKLRPKWIGPFRIIEVQSNALHCVKWDAEKPEQYRLHHHPEGMGTLVKKMVHPKDATLWTMPLPTEQKWDHKFAQQLFRGIRNDYIPSEWSSKSGSKFPPTTTSESDDSRPGDTPPSTNDDSSLYSDTARPPKPPTQPRPPTPPSPRTQTPPPAQSPHTPTGQQAPHSPAHSYASSGLTSMSEATATTQHESDEPDESDNDIWGGSSNWYETGIQATAQKLGPQSSPQSQTLAQEEDESREATAQEEEPGRQQRQRRQSDEGSYDGPARPSQMPERQREQQVADTSDSSEDNDNDDSNQQAKIVIPAPSIRPYQRLLDTPEMLELASDQLVRNLKRQEEMYAKALERYERLGHPDGRPPPQPVDVVHELLTRQGAKSKRKARETASKTMYLSGGFSNFEVNAAIKKIREYEHRQDVLGQKEGGQNEMGTTKVEFTAKAPAITDRKRKTRSTAGEPAEKVTKQVEKARSLPGAGRPAEHVTSQETFIDRATYGNLPERLQSPNKEHLPNAPDALTTTTKKTTHETRSPHTQVPSRKENEPTEQQTDSRHIPKGRSLARSPITAYTQHAERKEQTTTVHQETTEDVGPKEPHNERQEWKKATTLTGTTTNKNTDSFVDTAVYDKLPQHLQSPDRRNDPHNSKPASTTTRETYRQSDRRRSTAYTIKDPKVVHTPPAATTTASSQREGSHTDTASSSRRRTDLPLGELTSPASEISSKR